MMLPERYRRLWCRRLRRRPLLPFLVAATVAVDVVIEGIWFRDVSDSVIAASYGLLDAQLMLVAIYLAAGTAPLIVRLTLAILAASLFGLIDRNPTHETALLAYSVLLVEAAACAVVVWFLPRKKRRRPPRTRIASLLLWSVVVAIVCVWLRGSAGSELASAAADRSVWIAVGGQALIAATALLASRLIRSDWLACGLVGLIVLKLAVIDSLTTLSTTFGEALSYRGAAAAGVMLWLLALRLERREPTTTPKKRPSEASPAASPPSSIDLRG